MISPRGFDLRQKNFSKCFYCLGPILVVLLISVVFIGYSPYFHPVVIFGIIVILYSPKIIVETLLFQL